MHLRSILTFAIAATVSALAGAHEYTANKLHIAHPYARATVPHQPSGAAYLSIENRGETADKLIDVESPVAKSVEVHTMSMEGNVMKMRQVSAIQLNPSEKIEMKPGHGYHIMLIGLRQPLKAGETFPLTLTFEKAGKTEVSVRIQGISKTDGKHGSHHGH